MKLKLLNNLYVPETGETLAPGTEVEVNDEAKAQGLINRGTAVTLADADAAEQAADAPREGSVVESVTVNEVEYKKLVDENGETFYTANDEIATEDVFVTAKQTKVRQDMDKERQAAAEAEASQQPPLVQTQPTPEEIQKTLDETEI